MADNLDRQWWNALKMRLEKEMCQSEIVVRALPIERL
jgi:hypothetical protein